MATDSGFNVRFWGVRGTIPTPDAAFMRYGGNTSCVEVRCGAQTFILDAGTGIHNLGKTLTAQQIDILFSHTHIDHICGLPFFEPAYDANRRIDLWAGHLRPEYDLPQVVHHLMSPPVFPITPQAFRAEIHYHDFTAGEEPRTSRWLDAGIAVKTLPLHHPDRATGYRIEYAGHALCYITDIEHIPGALDPALVAFARNASCLIYDGTYDDDHFDRYRGWGHSTWQEAARIADAASVNTLVVFHHDPLAPDEMLDKRAAALEQIRPGSHMARESLELSLFSPDNHG